MPSGFGTSATESRQTYGFTISNRTDVDRDGRLVAFFQGQPEVKFGRDIWVPARSTMSTWLLMGPASVPPGSKLCELEGLLIDRTGGKDQLLLPATSEKIRGRTLSFRKREPMTAILLDEAEADELHFGRLPQPPSAADEAEELARAFRLACGNMSDHVSIVEPGPLSPTPEALDGITHFVIASERIAADPVGMQTLRHWLVQGGKLWIMLDRVRPEVVAPLLGDALDFDVIDRTSLSTTKTIDHIRGDDVAPAQNHERPVEFVRVLLPDSDQAIHVIQGWPTWFVRHVGRGKVLFTTLGPRGWHRPRSSNDPPAKFANQEIGFFSRTPVPLPQLARIAEELQLARGQNAFSLAEFEPMLAEEIGYAVISRTRVLLVFGGFLAAALVLGAALRRSRRPELLGWFGPVAAVGAAVTFFVVGEWTRRSATATVAVAQVIEAVAGHEEAAAHGLLAVYRPAEGDAPVGAKRGGFFELDMGGIEKRRMITTDRDAWHWEDLELPAGLRRAPFRTVLSLSEGLRANAQFGAEGVEGICAAGPFQELSDALLISTSGRNLAVRFAADGKFSVHSQDVLPPQQFLAGAVLTDQQQRRQELYRAFLKRGATDKELDSPRLLAWSRPMDMQFALAPDARAAGSALLTIPLHWEAPPAGAPVHIPGPLVPLRRVQEDLLTRLTFESSQRAEVHVRFQIPPSVLPLAVNRAKLSLKIDAPNREIVIAGRADGQWAEVHRVASPLDPLRIELAEQRLLQPDAGGGLHLQLSISELLRQEETKKGVAARTEKWTIEYLELEVDGVRK